MFLLKINWQMPHGWDKSKLISAETGHKIGQSGGLASHLCPIQIVFPISYAKFFSLKLTRHKLREIFGLAQGL